MYSSYVTVTVLGLALLLLLFVGAIALIRQKPGYRRRTTLRRASDMPYTGVERRRAGSRLNGKTTNVGGTGGRGGDSYGAGDAGRGGEGGSPGGKDGLDGQEVKIKKSRPTTKSAKSPTRVKMKDPQKGP